jgi:hypothetical protein
MEADYQHLRAHARNDFRYEEAVRENTVRIAYETYTDFVHLPLAYMWQWVTSA